MLNMTMKESDKKYFITDIEVKDGKLIVTKADGTSTEEPFTAHNLGVYRMKMVQEAKEKIEPFMDNLAKDSFFVFVKRYAAIIGGIVGLYFLYNFDIHIAMKIILTILLVLGEVAYYLYNELYLMVLSSDLDEVTAVEYYLKNFNVFNFFDNENYTDGFVVPPEDIGKYHLTKNMLEQLAVVIEDAKKLGSDPKDMRLVYNKVEKPKIVL